MRFSLQREVFLKPLAQVVNVVERRQTLPVLANLLVQVQGRAAVADRHRPGSGDGRAHARSTTPRTAKPRSRRASCSRSSVPCPTAARSPSRRPATRSRSRPAAAASRWPACRPTISRRSTKSKPPSACQRAGSRAEGTDRAHRVRDGAAGRALLPQRPAVRPARQALRCVATDGHRLALCEAPLDGGARPSARSSCRARACRNCSACSKAATASSSWKSAATTSASSATM